MNILNRSGNQLVGLMISTAVVTAGITALAMMSSQATRNMNGIQTRQKFNSLIENVKNSLNIPKNCNGNIAGVKFNKSKNPIKGAKKITQKNADGTDSQKTAIKLFDNQSQETSYSVLTENTYNSGLLITAIDFVPMEYIEGQSTGRVPLKLQISATSSINGTNVEFKNDPPILIYADVKKNGDDNEITGCYLPNRQAAGDVTNSNNNNQTSQQNIINGDLHIKNGKLFISDVEIAPIEGACLVAETLSLANGAIQVQKFVKWIKPQTISACGSEAMAKCEDGKFYYKGLMGCPSQWADATPISANSSISATCEGGKHSMSVSAGGISKWGKSYRCNGSASWVP